MTDAEIKASRAADRAVRRAALAELRTRILAVEDSGGFEWIDHGAANYLARGCSVAYGAIADAEAKLAQQERLDGWTPATSPSPA